MGFLTANDSPGRHAPSWYAETAGPLPEHPRLEGAHRADVCVVGGGYAGLSAALHLAERGLDVVLLDAHRVGWGASGRNGGQLGYGPRAPMSAYERLVGPEDARKVWEIATGANALVRALIARHGIACGLTPGCLDAAVKPAHARAIAAEVAHLREVYGHPDIEALPRDALHARLPSRRYHGGARDGMAAHLHPLRLALGYARAAAAAGARLFERSPATRIAEGRVETASGHVEAAWVIAAMNGYIDGLEPRIAAPTLPLNNFIAATEPLDPARAARLIPGRDCVSDSLFVLNYYRLSEDNRLLWGGGESFGMRFPRDIRAVVRPRMLAVFPELADLRLTHAWGGTLAITATRFPSFRRVGRRVLGISGWSGSGIHMATMGGAIAAEAVGGTLARWDVMARLPTPPFPGGRWLRAPLATAAMLWYALRDRL